MSKVIIFAHKTHPDAVIPQVAYNNTSAAFDITAVEDVVIPAGGSRVVPNGLRLTIDQQEKYFMQVQLRSSLGFKYDMVPHAGVIDSGYTGDLGIKVYNIGNEDYIVSKGDRYAQILVLPRPDFEIKELNQDEFEELKTQQLRGDKGFGSSNK